MRRHVFYSHHSVRFVASWLTVLEVLTACHVAEALGISSLSDGAEECVRIHGLVMLGGHYQHNRTTASTLCSLTHAAKACREAYVDMGSGEVLKCQWDVPAGHCTSRAQKTCGSIGLRHSFKENWDRQKDRLWLGKDWFANNAQDWQIARGRVECISNFPQTSGRTAHLLTQFVPDHAVMFFLEVTVDMVEPGKLEDRAFAGVLVKMGGPHSDYRQTALVQMVPAPGGGLLIGIGADGYLHIRKFTEQWGSPNSLWTAHDPSNQGYDFRALPTMATSRHPLPSRAWPFKLQITWSPSHPLSARAIGSDGIAIHCSHELVQNSMGGGISLFSAYGPRHSTKGFAFDEFRLNGTVAAPERAFGPVLGVLYTVSTHGSSHDGLTGADVRDLRMTVQHPVLGPGHVLRLLLSIDGGAPVQGTFHSDDLSWTTRFVVPYEHRTRDVGYRLLLDGAPVYSGLIKREKTRSEETRLASLSCTKNAYGMLRWDSHGLWFPFANVTASLGVHDPDILFFSGDQVYDGDITPADIRSEYHALLDFHTKWQRFLWSFGSLTKDRPTVAVPDDHDMWQGNLFGGGGRTNVGHSEVGRHKEPNDHHQGLGYCYSNSFVNAVQAVMVSHLPPRSGLLPPAVGNEGLTTFSTAFRFSGVDFLVLADRTWKAGPYDRSPDPPLLGNEQEAFLEKWAQTEQHDAWTKVVLSESPWSCLTTAWKGTGSHGLDHGHTHIVQFGDYPDEKEAHLHSYVPYLAANMGFRDALNEEATDTNGYPPLARSRAVRLLAKAGALHLTGDQHLGVVAQYGADEWGDSTVVFSSPAVASAFPRRWMPNVPGMSQWQGAKRYMGDYMDVLGNRFTVLAVSNPVKGDPSRHGVPQALAEKSPGYGIVRFRAGSSPGDLEQRQATVTLENWPNWADPRDPRQMYEDWPVVLDEWARPLAPLPVRNLSMARSMPPDPSGKSKSQQLHSLDGTSSSASPLGNARRAWRRMAPR